MFLFIFAAGLALIELAAFAGWNTNPESKIPATSVEIFFITFLYKDKRVSPVMYF